MLFRYIVTAVALAGCSRAVLVDLNTSASKGKSILQSTTFDYVVVGGGTAGLTIARRLADAFSLKKVLVLEAGGSGVGDDIVTIPKNSFAFVGTDKDWGFQITGQEHANGQEINLSSGKILGGDSAVNGLVWVRGAKEEYDAYESLGSSTWNWDNLYQYMLKSETLNSPSAELTDEFGFVAEASPHGTTGPVDLSFPKFLPLQHQKLIEASVEVGHTFNNDPYSGNPNGVFYSLSSQTNAAVRESSELAYITSVISKPNLYVYTHATVSKVNLVAQSGSQKATGVQVVFPDGSVATAKTKGEVVLSAGVVRTPQILELSGVGDSSVLTPLGIETKINNPGVGANYEDHTLTILTYQLKEGFLSFDALGYNETLAALQEELYQSAQGWLTFAQGVLNFEPIDKILTKEEIEEAKAILATKPVGISDEQFTIIKNNILNGRPQVEYLLFNSFSGGEVKLPDTSYISLAVTHLHPLSRGSIHITSTSINDHPIIDPHFLEAEWDKWFLAKATAFGRKLMKTQAFSEILEDVETFPGPGVQTHDDWVQFVKETVNSGYHSIGSASLLPQDKSGVVDPKLKVYGTSNLRVADTSIMPSHISAHTQSIAYAIGEKAADIIINL